MRQTSILAFRSLNKIGDRQRRVFNAIEEIGPATDKQLGEHLSWPINTITPRRGELVGAGKIVEAYRDRDINTGRLVTFWKPAITNVMLFEDVA